MITVSATELKNNFKAYADKISHGEMVIIKRPKDEKNIIMISENEHMKEGASLVNGILNIGNN